MLKSALHDLDRILRGEKTRLIDLQDGTVDVSFPGLTFLIVILGAITGVCMGVFALFRDPPAFQQMIASSIKVPLLFLLTLAITFPSLYVFNALVGSRLRLVALAKLLIASLGVTVSLTAAFGPIIAFFSLSTTSYPFMVLLNVAVYAVAGILGLYFLLQTMHRITSLDLVEPNSKLPATQSNYELALEYEAGKVDTSDVAQATVDGPQPKGQIPGPQKQQPHFRPPNSSGSKGALDRLEGLVLAGYVRTVFRCWIVVFALVGAQMSWVLRPFIGAPGTPFTWFRERGSNFFAAVLESFVNLF